MKISYMNQISWVNMYLPGRLCWLWSVWEDMLLFCTPLGKYVYFSHVTYLFVLCCSAICTWNSCLSSLVSIEKTLSECKLRFFFPKQRVFQSIQCGFLGSESSGMPWNPGLLGPTSLTIGAKQLQVILSWMSKHMSFHLKETKTDSVIESQCSFLMFLSRHYLNVGPWNLSFTPASCLLQFGNCYLHLGLWSSAVGDGLWGDTWKALETFLLSTARTRVVSRAAAVDNPRPLRNQAWVHCPGTHRWPVGGP